MEMQAPKDVHDLALSADGRRLLTAVLDDVVRLWDVESGKELRRLYGHKGDVFAVSFSPDARYALSGGEDRTRRLWRLPEQEKK